MRISERADRAITELLLLDRKTEGAAGIIFGPHRSSLGTTVRRGEGSHENIEPPGSHWLAPVTYDRRRSHACPSAGRDHVRHRAGAGRLVFRHSDIAWNPVSG